MVDGVNSSGFFCNRIVLLIMTTTYKLVMRYKICEMNTIICNIVIYNFFKLGLFYIWKIKESYEKVRLLLQIR